VKPLDARREALPGSPASPQKLEIVDNFASIKIDSDQSFQIQHPGLTA
jgi:hypothetical protein